MQISRLQEDEYQKINRNKNKTVNNEENKVVLFQDYFIRYM